MSASDAKPEPFQFSLQTLLKIVLFVALAIGAIQLSYRCRRLSLECEEAEARLTIQQEEAKELRRVAHQLQEEACTLKSLMGFPVTMTVNDISQQFDLDMNTFAPDVPEQERYYRALWLRKRQSSVDADDGTLDGRVPAGVPH